MDSARREHGARLLRLTLLTALLLAGAPARADGTADDLLRDGAGVLGGGLDPLRVSETWWNPDQVLFVLRGPAEERVELEVLLSGSARPGAVRGDRYDVVVNADPAVRAAFAAPIDVAIARVRANEGKGPVLRRHAARDRAISGTPPPERAVAEPPMSLDAGHADLDDLPWTRLTSLALAALLLLVSLGFLPLLARAARRQLPGGALVASLLAVAVMAQLLAPSRPVLEYHGYARVYEAWRLLPSELLGPGYTVLVGPLLRLLGPSLQIVIGANLVLGLLSVPLAGAVAARIGGRAAAPVAIALVALAPALLSDRGSDTLGPSEAFFLLGGLVLLGEWLDRQRRALLAGAACFLAFAMLTVPSAIVAVPLLVGALVAAHEGPISRRPLLVAALAVAVALVPRVLVLTSLASNPAGRGMQPFLIATGPGEGPIQWFLSRNALMRSDVQSLLTLAVALSAVVLAPRGLRVARSLWLLAAIAWVASTISELSGQTVVRAQGVAVLLACVLAAAPLARWLRAGSLALRAGAVAMALAIVVPTPGQAEALWGQRESQRFDAWWRGAIGRVPRTDARRCVVALGEAERPLSPEPRYYPTYEVGAVSGGMEQWDIGSALANTDWLLSGRCEVVYVRGPQCMPGGVEHALCARVAMELQLVPIAETNGDPTSLDPRRYGIYRVSGLRAPTSPPAI